VICAMVGKKVKCCDCGFLGVRGRTHELADTFGDIRELPARARLGVFQWLESLHVDAYLDCFRGQGHIVAGETSPRWGVAISHFHKGVTQPRRCRYYYHYDPGYTPSQHLDLQRERDQRRFLIIVSLLSATIGAGIATLVNLLL